MVGARHHHKGLAVLICFVVILTAAAGQALAQEEAIDPVATREYAVALGFQK